jgi:hypothetical protein
LRELGHCYDPLPQCVRSNRPASYGFALREELDLNQAVDVFWFYFGYPGLSTLHDENGSSYERAEQWLCREASRALLRVQRKTLLNALGVSRS